MLQPIVRSVTTKSAIPAGSALAGTVQGVVTGTKFYIRGTGTNFLSIVPILTNHHFIYIPAHNFLAKIVSISNNTLMMVDADPTAVTAGSAAQFVNANLLSYTILDEGAGSYVYNGVAVSAGTPAVNQHIDAYNNSFRTLQAAWVDGTGTTLLITENL